MSDIGGKRTFRFRGRIYEIGERMGISNASACRIGECPVFLPVVVRRKICDFRIRNGEKQDERLLLRLKLCRCRLQRLVRKCVCQYKAKQPHSESREENS